MPSFQYQLPRQKHSELSLLGALESAKRFKVAIGTKHVRGIKNVSHFVE
jgi:hypothetical protein